MAGMTKEASDKVREILAQVNAIERIQARLRLSLGQLGTVGLFVDDARLGAAEGHVDQAIGDLVVLAEKLNARAMNEFPDYLVR